MASSGSNRTAKRWEKKTNNQSFSTTVGLNHSGAKVQQLTFNKIECYKHTGRPFFDTEAGRVSGERKRKHSKPEGTLSKLNSIKCVHNTISGIWENMHFKGLWIFAQYWQVRYKNSPLVTLNKWTGTIRSLVSWEMLTHAEVCSCITPVPFTVR